MNTSDGKHNLILNTPCFPKNLYHAGNAISQIITDIVYRHQLFLGKSVKYACHSWNLHGKKIEHLVKEQGIENPFYVDIKRFSTFLVEDAIFQKNFFVEYDFTIDNNLISVSDTDEDFINFTKEQFNKLYLERWIVEKDGKYFFELQRLNNSDLDFEIDKLFELINTYPSFQRNTILSVKSTINESFPIEKERLFSVNFVLNGRNVSLNPIFQSLLLPLYVSTKYNTEYPTLFLSSSSGRNILKWHYLRVCISSILTKNIPCKNLFLHGTLLTKSNENMSKYREGAIQPSDLFNIKKDKSFVRYVLLRSLSFKNIKLQLERSLGEWQKIEDKILKVKKGNYVISNYLEIEREIFKSLKLLEEFNIQGSFEIFYLAMRKADLIIGQFVHTPFQDLFNIFLAESNFFIKK